MNTLSRRGSAASQRGRIEKLSFPSEAEDQNDDFLARTEQRHFLVLFGDKKYIPMQSIGTGRPYCKSYTQLINPSAPPGHLPEGELAAGQEKPAWAVTQGRLGPLQKAPPSNKQKPLPPGVSPTGSEGVRGHF